MSGTYIPASEFTDKAAIRERLLAAFSDATGEEIRDGLVWYTRAHEFAHSLASVYHVDVETVAKVIALLSPMVEWGENKELAVQALYLWRAGKPGHLPCLSDSWRKARLLLDGRDISCQSSDGFGPKTGPFWQTIADPDNLALPAVVDSHMLALVTGRGAGSYRATGKSIRTVGEVMADIARELGILIHQLQSIVWLVFLRWIAKQSKA